MDTTKLVVDILSEALSVPVSTDMPTDRAERLVLVDLSGDQSTPYLLMPRYDLTCWGLSDMDAKGIAVSAVDALRNASFEHPYLSACQLETLSREEWSRNGQGRYLAVVDLVINIDE